MLCTPDVAWCWGANTRHLNPSDFQFLNIARAFSQKKKTISSHFEKSLSDIQHIISRSPHFLANTLNK